ncbi:hypothetical protein GGS21DRAFT_111076 [Xylaria nigripes]|nr:hypothetical protein GGS21DRAFT_111076 [Xylaria nigripes]
MSFRQITALVVLSMASFVAADQKGVELPAQPPSLGSDTVAGCFSSLGDMILDSTNDFNTQGSCAQICREKSKPVGATYAKACFCGTLMPNKKTLLPDTSCNEPCPGYDPQACGGLDAYTVYNTGVVFNVAEAPLPSSSTTDSSTASSASSTQTSSPSLATTSADKPSDNGSSKTIGIAVGVVVGVVVITALGAAVYFYMRRKRHDELEEEHRRNAAVNSFIGSGKPRSSGGMSIADSRMDPGLNRRMSDGSIADNQDYSRRILRVTNA